MIAWLLLGALAANDPQVSQYLRDPVRVYDAKGVLTGALGKSELPPLPAKIVGRNASGQPGVSNGGSVIYLRTGDVQTKNADSDCTALAVPNRQADVRLAATDVGASSNLSATASTCILKPGK